MKVSFELELDVEFDYSAPVEATRTDPPVYEELEITSVTLGGLEISQYLEEEHIVILTDAALEELHNIDPPEPEYTTFWKRDTEI